MRFGIFSVVDHYPAELSRTSGQFYGELLEQVDDILLRAWSGEPVSYEGRYHRVQNVRLNVLPLQRPHPPVWIAILRNEAAAQVGKRGFSPMMIPYATTEHLGELAETVTAFRAAYAASGRDLAEATVPFGLHTYVADSFEAAPREAKEAMDRYVRTRLYARQRPYELLVDKQLIAFGGPEDVIRVARSYERAGLTDFLAITNFGGLAHARVLRSMELMARHVLPAFRG